MKTPLMFYQTIKNTITMYTSTLMTIDLFPILQEKKIHLDLQLLAIHIMFASEQQKPKVKKT